MSENASSPAAPAAPASTSPAPAAGAGSPAGASNPPSDPAGAASPPKPAEAAPSWKPPKIKRFGQEVEPTEADYHRWAQIGAAGEYRFQDLSAKEQAIQAQKARFAQDPLAVYAEQLREQGMDEATVEKTIDRLAAQRVLAYRKAAEETEDQRALREERAKREALERKFQEQEEAAKQAEVKRHTDERFTDKRNRFQAALAALETKGEGKVVLPETSRNLTFMRMAHIEDSAVGEKPTAEELAGLVEADMRAETALQVAGLKTRQQRLAYLRAVGFDSNQIAKDLREEFDELRAAKGGAPAPAPPPAPKAPPSLPARNGFNGQFVASPTWPPPPSPSMLAFLGYDQKAKG